MAETLKVGCARPTGGVVGALPKLSTNEETNEKKEVQDMIRIGKKPLILPHQATLMANLSPLPCPNTWVGGCYCASILEILPLSEQRNFQQLLKNMLNCKS